MDLDEPGRYRDLDASGMLRCIRELPEQCEAAWRLAHGLDLPSSYRSVRHVVILGMGGSAIGGAFVQGLLSDGSAVPITLVRDYVLPAFIAGEKYLVIGCSYSGNTEETLLALEEAAGRGVHLAALTTGGQLAVWATEKGVPLVCFDYPSQPRAALGYSFVLLLGILWRVGLAPDFSSDLAEAAQVMRDWQTEIDSDIPTSRNAAKALALQLRERLAVVYGAGLTAPVANRWKTQFNENAKHWAFFEVLPELHHNAVVGFRYPSAVRERAFVIMLCSSFDFPRIQLRWKATEELLAREGVSHTALYARGTSRLAQVLSLVHFGDYVSYYLAMLNDVDPTPIEAIAFLKQKLSGTET